MKNAGLPWRLYLLSRRIRKFNSTHLARLRSRFWGIRLGSGSSFSGPFRVRRAPGSKIRIGRCFKAEGGQFDNPLGLNCPNLIQTHKVNANLCIGNDVGISGVVISCTTRITIGNSVLIGANARIFDSDFHPVESDNRRYDRTGVKCSPIFIGDNCWIGSGAVLLPGTELKQNVVVAANAVVKGSFGPDCIIGGVPARVIRELGSG